MASVQKRKRASGITVMLTGLERQEVGKAAEAAGLSLSVFIRLMVMAALKRGETITAAKAA